MSSEDNNSLWGGRFSEPTDSFVQRFTASVAFDQRMAAQDIRGSLAHARMLESRGILSAQELVAIDAVLEKIAAEITTGSFQLALAREDVHMNLESRLTDLRGDAGKKLHTGR